MMHWYFHANQDGADSIEQTERIRKSLDRPDVWLTTNINGQLQHASHLPPGETPSLERVDAIVIEGTRADADVGFLLAHAITLKKPTLYLYQRGTVPKVFQHLPFESMPAWIHVVSYQTRTLDRHIEEFILATAGKRMKPAPRIKFTLRITNMIEDYLRYKTVNTKTSKADWVRDMIERLMAEDKDWQKSIKRRQDEEG